MKEQNIKECHGFVVLLDALGMKERMRFEEKNAKEMILDWEYLLSKSEESKKDFSCSLKKDILVKGVPTGILFTDESGSEKQKIGFSNIIVRGFSDTLVLILETKHSSAIDIASLAVLHAYLAKIFLYALDRKFMLRGCVSFGEIAYTDNFVAGKAMNDAAAWFEQLDMIGVMLTPHVSNLVKSDINKIKNLWIEYQDTPLKKGKALVHLLNWAFYRDFLPPSIGSLEKLVMSILCDNNILPSVLSKYENTYKFYEHIKEIIIDFKEALESDKKS